MRYFKHWLGCFLCAGLCAGLPAQTQTSTPGHAKSSILPNATAEDSVRAAVNELFLAMKSSDADRLKATFTDSALLQTIVTTKEGKTIASNESVAEFAASIGKLPEGAADERIRFDVV